MTMFFPSIHPSLFNSSRNGSKRTELPEAVLLSRKPMRKIFPGCCAWADEAVVSKTVISSQIRDFDLILVAPAFAET
jgi:hypothetical protein